MVRFNNYCIFANLWTKTHHATPLFHQRIRPMKRIFTIVIILLSFLIPGQYASSQTPSKDQKKMEKQVRKEAKKEAKTLAKQGWEAAPGNLSIQSQLEESFMMQHQKDEKGYPRYISGEATTVGASYSSASFMAMEMAKIDLTGKMSTDITALITTKVETQQLSKDQASSLSQSVANSKSFLSQRLGRVLNPVKMMRKRDDGNVEVRMVIFYDYETAQALWRQGLKEELNQREDGLGNTMIELLDL